MLVERTCRLEHGGLPPAKDVGPASLGMGHGQVGLAHCGHLWGLRCRPFGGRAFGDLLLLLLLQGLLSGADVLQLIDDHVLALSCRARQNMITVPMHHCTNREKSGFPKRTIEPREEDQANCKQIMP